MTDVTIVAGTDGPFHVPGPVQLRRKDGSVIADVTDEAWLCRCGHSGNKPFCDSSHRTCGFADHPTTPWAGKASPEAGNSVVTVRPNGPYFVEGHVTVQNDEGAVLARGSRIVLCRCGASATKPFCDASHRTSGFEAD